MRFVTICWAALSLVLGQACDRQAETPAATPPDSKETTMSDIYDFSLNTIDGTPAPLSEKKGKVLLIVNVASECGFTPQYEGLQKLHEKYEEKGLVVMGIPSNDFGGQEPGTSEEIKAFCESKFSVTFPLFEKVGVKNDPHPLYAYLQERKGAVDWNFNKFLIGKDGTILAHFPSGDEPQSKKVVSAIEAAL